jgi:hypothetical protein
MQTESPHPRRAFVLLSTTTLFFALIAMPLAHAADPVADLQAGYATRDTAIAGDPDNGVDFKMQVTNNGPDASDGFDIVVTFPGTNAIPSPSLLDPPTDSANCDPFVLDTDTSSVTCHISSLAMQSGGTPIAFAEVVGTVAPSVPAGTSLTATATATPTGSATDPNTDNNSSTTAPTIVQAFADLTIVKSVSTPVGTPADTIYANTDPDNSKVVFHLSLTNDGPSDAQNVAITDTLDPDLLTAAVCTGGPECSSYPDTIVIGTLASGATKTFDIEAHANPDLGHATHSNPDDRAPGPYPNENTATVDSTTPPNTTDSRSSTPPDTTIDTAPGSPVIQFSVPGQTDAAIEWTAPASNGGRPITQYHVVAAPCPGGGSSCTVVTNNNVSNASIGGTPAFSYIIPGLTTNTTYRFDVFATNDVGDSDAASVFVTPNISADNNVIPQTGSASVDTGLAGGAMSTCPGGDPSSATCKNIVGQYSLSAPSDAGSVFGLSTVPNDQSLSATTLSFVAARNLAVTQSSTSTGPCYEVEFDPTSSDFAKIVSPSTCNVVANKAVLSTYPTTVATLTTPHLEITQEDSTVTTLKLGAPCFQLRTDTRAGRNNAVILDSTGLWTCLNPQTSKKGGGPMPECPEGVGWTLANQCAYLYYSVVNVPGYDLHPNSFTPPNVRPTDPTKLIPPSPCTFDPSQNKYCSQPIIIGGSVQQGIKFVETCTNPNILTTCATPVPITFNGATSQVRPWCVGKFPNFQYLPCVFKAQWLNKSTGNGNNDIQFQEYMTGDPGKRTTG